MTSESVQDYLKTIYEMGCEGGMEWVSTTVLPRGGTMPRRR